MCYDNCALSLPKPPHTIQKSDMFTLWHERLHDWKPWLSSAAAHQKGHENQRAVLNGENQTRVVESLNMTTFKIRTGMWLARTTVQTYLTQRSFLWQIMGSPPQITGSGDLTVIQFFCDCFGVNFAINQTFMWWNVAVIKSWKQNLTGY